MANIENTDALVNSVNDEFRMLVEHAPGLVAVVDEDRISFINEAGAILLGATCSGDLLGGSFIRFVHGESRPTLSDLSSRPAGRADGIIKLVRADGLTLRVQMSVFEVAFGGIRQLAFCANDRTEMFQAVSVLRAREERVIKILDTVIDGIITVDGYGMVERFNRSAEQVFGISAGRVIGQSVEPFIISATNQRLLRDRSVPSDPVGSLRYAMEQGDHLAELYRADGTTFVAEMSITELVDQGARRFTVLVRDVTERRRFEERLERMALYDGLTGLPNRSLLLRRLDAMVSERPQTGDGGIVMLIDLDRFKNVNDFFGHSFGDRLITAVAARLDTARGPSEFLARLSGDEFVLVTASATPHDDIARIAARLAATLEEPFVIDGFELFVTASIGAVVFPDHAGDTATLLKNVESATYFAKDHGRNTTQVYSDTVHQRRAGRLDLETELRKALEAQGFTLAYQPRLDVASGTVRGMEALLRWNHPTLGPLSPGKFIPVAEESGLIVPIGDVVLNAAAIATKNWIERGYGPLTVAVNLSTRQFRDAGLVSRIAQVLDRTGLAPEALEIEITESGLMYEVDRVMDVLADLKSLGVSVAVDDFGMGYSSLGYLKNFPIDVLKIDQSFIQGLPDPGDVAISTAIVAMSKSLNLRVVAEGVETQQQHDIVCALGCEEVQGYHFSRPLAPDDFGLFVQNFRLLTAPVPSIIVN